MANALTGLGVQPGDRVAVQVEKSVQAIILYLATLRAGAVFLPLNTGYTPAEIGYFLGDAEPQVFVCDPARQEALREPTEAAGARMVTLDAVGRGSLTDAADAAEAFATVARDRDDLAALLYTSGTTGRSKGAMLTHGNLVSNARVLREACGFRQLGGPGLVMRCARRRHWRTASWPRSGFGRGSPIWACRRRGHFGTPTSPSVFKSNSMSFRPRARSAVRVPPARCRSGSVP